MLAHLIPRLLQSLAVVFVVVSLVFVGTRLIGDPIDAFSAQNATPEAIEAAKERLGLLDPLIVQYGKFLAGVVQLDFGESLFTGQSAWDEVMARLWATVQLSVAAFVLIIAIGVPIGVLAAVRRGSIPDLIARIIALVGQAMPNFWLGLLLIFIFAVKLGWLPTSGRGGFDNLVLPAITLAGFGAAAAMRLTRSGMLDVLSNDYIRTAQAKGLTQPHGDPATRPAQRAARPRDGAGDHARPAAGRLDHRRGGLRLARRRPARLPLDRAARLPRNPGRGAGDRSLVRGRQHHG